MNTKGNVFRIVFSLLILFGHEASCNVFTVVNTFDNVLGSLRRAMLNSNAVSGKDTIDFNIPGSQWQIVLLTELPVITDSVFIDGLSQPGSSFANSNLVEIVGNANLDFGIDFNSFNIMVVGLKIINFTTGSALFDQNNSGIAIGDIILSHIIVENCFFAALLDRKPVNGLTISNCLFSNSTFMGVKMVLRDNSDNIEVSSNRFINVSGISNFGIIVESGYSHFDSTLAINIKDNIFDGVIGGVVLAMGGNCEFINVENNSFFNLIGTAIDLGSGSGVRANIKLSTIHNNYIDSTCSGYGIRFGSTSAPIVMDSIEVYNNIILTSGTGISVFCSPSQNDDCKLTNIFIYDNFIRNCQNGIRYYFNIRNPNCLLSRIYSRGNEISNCTLNGFLIDASTSNNNTLGSKVQYLLIDSNYIHDNFQNGVYIDAFSISGLLMLKELEVKRNLISNNVGDGIQVYSYKTNYDGLKFTQNSIFNNGRKGIVEIDGNNLNLYGKPKIPTAQFDSLLYNGTKGDLYGHLQSLPNRVYKIEFFSSVNIDSSGFGEGETYLFTRRIVTDSTGYVNFHFNLPQSSIGLYISSTVTDSLMNHTSEFSNSINNIISGVNEIEDNGNSFYVFPNPAHRYTTIQRVDVSSETQLALFDVTGRIVKTIWFPKGLAQVYLDVDSIEEGMYVLRNMKAKNNENGVKLIVAKP
jgi:Secretion system C-terminal sorting domain